MPGEAVRQRPGEGVIKDRDRAARPGPRDEVGRREEHVSRSQGPSQAEGLPDQSRPMFADQPRRQPGRPRHARQPLRIARDQHGFRERPAGLGPLREQAFQAAPDPGALGRQPLTVDHQPHAIASALVSNAPPSARNSSRRSPPDQTNPRDCPGAPENHVRLPQFFPIDLSSLFPLPFSLPVGLPCLRMRCSQSLSQNEPKGEAASGSRSGLTGVISRCVGGNPNGSTFRGRRRMVE